MEPFGHTLRRLRLDAGLGLRTFAALIDQRASTVSAMESLRRGPWRQKDLRRRAAEALALPESSAAWRQLVTAPASGAGAEEVEALRPRVQQPGAIRWWTLSDQAPRLESADQIALADFIDATSAPGGARDGAPPRQQPLTDLAIEWRARRLLGPRDAPAAAAPIDVEAALESAGVRLEILPGLAPRFSVQCCLLETSQGWTVLVDRAIADAHPLSAYRFLIAQTFAVARLWPASAEIWPRQLEACDLAVRRDSFRFALALMLPASALDSAAQAAYADLVDQQGWLPLAAARRSLCNRLAQQFAVPVNLVDARLAGWPAHIYDRLEIALAAGERSLPPADWLVTRAAARQQLLFT